MKLVDEALCVEVHIGSVEDLAKAVERLREHAIFNSPSDEVDSEPFAEQFFLAAVALLDQAHRNLMLAELHLRRARRPVP
jgi:hypothetical protein